ncbi:hypothetical protein FWH30_01020 [Microgenomates group bacterium]|nr:hypothetical protein [Microgenomates group bacterium]
MKVVLRLVLVITLFLGSMAGVVRANESDYQIVLETKVEIGENGQMTVTDKWQVTNLTATKYLAEFGYEVDGEVKNIKSSEQKLSVSTQKNDGEGSLVLIKMTEPVVGEQKTATWEVSYELNSNVVLLNSQPLLAVVKMPSIVFEGQIDEQSREVVWEESWGEPRLEAGEILIFGEKQRLLLTAQMERKNMANAPMNVEINIPRTPLVSIEPLPEKIKELSDGRMVATFLSKEQEELHIQYQSVIEIEPQEWIEISGMSGQMELLWEQLLVINDMGAGEWLGWLAEQWGEELGDGQLELQLLHEDDRIEISEEIAQIERESEYEQKERTREVLFMAGIIGGAIAGIGGLLVLIRKKRNPLRR